MLIPSPLGTEHWETPSLSRRVNANSQHRVADAVDECKLIKKGEC